MSFFPNNWRRNILLLCPEVRQGDVANWKEPNTGIERGAAYHRFDHNSVNSEPISVNISSDCSWEREQPVTTQVRSNTWLQPVRISP